MFTIGIDLGGTGVQAGVVDENNRIIGRGERPTAMPRPADEIMDDVAAACRDAIAEAGLTIDDIEYVGIGSPGTANSSTGIIEFAGNLGMKQYPMAQALTDRLGKPVFLANDADSAAYGEVMAGAAKGHDNVVFVTLGTGVGGGVIIDGKIITGFNHAGGELGHTVIVEKGIPCNCGRSGCWEKYASATALINQTRDAMEGDPNSAMWQIAGSLEKVNGKTAFDGMRAGDPVAQEVVDKYIYHVACGIINVINVFQPAILCIGGGISKEKENLLAPLRKIVEAERFSKYAAQQTELVAAQLGNDAGIIGAANLYRLKK